MKQRIMIFAVSSTPLAGTTLLTIGVISISFGSLYLLVNRVKARKGKLPVFATTNVDFLDKKDNKKILSLSKTSKFLVSNLLLCSLLLAIMVAIHHLGKNFFLQGVKLNLKRASSKSMLAYIQNRDISPTERAIAFFSIGVLILGITIIEGLLDPYVATSLPAYTAKVGAQVVKNGALSAYAADYLAYEVGSFLPTRIKGLSPFLDKCQTKGGVLAAGIAGSGLTFANGLVNLPLISKIASQGVKTNLESPQILWETILEYSDKLHRRHDGFDPLGSAILTKRAIELERILRRENPDLFYYADLGFTYNSDVYDLLTLIDWQT